jgi:ferrous iron transport protein A
MMTLDNVSTGKTVKIVRLNSTGPVKRRLMDMGLLKGVEATVLRIAPLGDPVELSVRGYDLSIRKSEAALIEVEA